MLFDLDKPVRATNFGRITQKSGYWHKGRTISENLVLYCTDGSVCMQIGKETYRAEKGDILFVRAGEFYRPLDCEGCTYYFFHFRAHEHTSEYSAPERITVVRHPDIPRDCFAYSCHKERESLVRLLPHIKGVPSCVGDILERASRLDPSARFYDIVMLDALLCELLISVQTSENQHSHPKRFAQMLSFIDANYSGKISLGVLSEKFGLSESYIARMFRRELSQKPSEYINGVRISAARSLLLHTELTVSEIAEKTGFSDVYYFSRFFSKICGASPSAFRNAKG